MTAPVAPVPSRPVPWRTIWAAIGAVLGTVVAILIVQHISRVLVWIVIAAFFAIVLSPPVNFLQHRLHFPRALATVVVFIVGLAVLAALLYAFIRPVVDQTQRFVDNFPRYVEEARAGRGPLGGVVKRYDLDRRLEESQDDIKANVNRLGNQSVDILARVGNAVASTLTIIVLTILMLLSGPKMLQGGLNILSPPKRDHVRHVAADCAKAVTGYVAGNLLISVVAGVSTFVALWVIGVPFRTVLALWVAFADLIPLVGATLGAIPAVLVAFLNSTGMGIATVLFFVAYQQFENHVLQVTIMSRTVSLNPLVVLVSVLVGVELSGILGALLAIPLAGVIHVISRDVLDSHRGGVKEEPTIGSNQVPVSEAAQTAEAANTAEDGEDGELAAEPPSGDGADARPRQRSWPWGRHRPSEAPTPEVPSSSA
jgi:predicted PurR-regulated permease PerM